MDFVDVGRVPRTPMLNNRIVVRFFDGASKCDGNKCDVRVVLKITNSIIFKVKMNFGSGTNSIAKLLTLW